MCRKEDLISTTETTEELVKPCGSMKIESTNTTSPLPSMLLAIITAYCWLQFALVFPFLLWHDGASKTYVLANFQYDHENTKFDNTIWTYGTDYGIALFMFFGAIHCWRSAKDFYKLRFLSTSLLTCYCISVSFGGYAHQHYLTLESLNTTSFKIVWIICVGTVTLAGGFIGAIGTELGKTLQGMNHRVNIPILPQYFWIMWGLYLTAECARGSISYKRPACDIFIAGTTQSIPTFYTLSILHSCYWKEAPLTKRMGEVRMLSKLQTLVSKTLRAKMTVAFLMNAPLLPLYPILLSFGLKLGSVNAILHTNLFIAWGSQYRTLHHFVKALQEAFNFSIEKRV